MATRGVKLRTAVARTAQRVQAAQAAIDRVAAAVRELEALAGRRRAEKPLSLSALQRAKRAAGRRGT